MQIKLNTPTPLESYSFKGVDFLLKRDDLINKELSGNKARKAHFLIENPPENITSITSYGSIQSNAMYSLSYLAKEFGIDFYYHANHIPTLLRDNPQGNLALSLKNGMILKEGYESIEKSSNTLFIKEGIAQKEAYYGIYKLAKELIEQTTSSREYQLFLSSGTGTTAIFLTKALKELGADNITVYTTPCVGKSSYLLEQFRELEEESIYYPKILESKKRYHFGKLYREFYLLWLELQRDLNIEFELLYDPKSWIVILENRELFSNLIYIHQGGLIGNSSMLHRYERKFGSLNENS